MIQFFSFENLKIAKGVSPVKALTWMSFGLESWDTSADIWLCSVHLTPQDNLMHVLEFGHT